MKAIWNGKVIADSLNTELVEGNHYFPEDSLRKQFFESSEHKTTCPWKGEASYFSLNVGGKLNTDAAWYYPNPKDAAKNIKGYVAFWKGVEIVK